MTAVMSASRGAELHIADLDVHFGGVHAIRGVSLDARRGRTMGIIGPNGAGKTTILNAVCGIVPSTGSVVVDGQDIRQVPVHRLRQRGVSRSFQHPQLDPHMTVRGHLAVGLVYRRPYGWLAASLGPSSTKRRRADRHDQEQVERMLALLSLEAWADMSVSDAAHGVHKLTDIGRAMMGEPDLLLLDEPFAGLSTDEQQGLVEILKSLQRELGMTVVVIDHHVETVASVADDLLALVAGQVAAYGTSGSVLADPVVKKAYLG